MHTNPLLTTATTATAAAALKRFADADVPHPDTDIPAGRAELPTGACARVVGPRRDHGPGRPARRGGR